MKGAVMRRRRKNNPLLMRIVGITILAHIIALPILAHFEAFKVIRRDFIDTRLINLPPPQKIAEKPERKRDVKQPPRKAKATHKSAEKVAQAHHAPKSNLTQPKLIASAPGTGNGGSDANSVNANGSGQMGVVPTNIKPAAKQTGPPKETVTKPVEETTPPPPPPKPVEKPKKPEQIAQVPQIVNTPPPVNPQPIFTKAVAISAPDPTIPDDIRTSDINKTLVLLVTVTANGDPTDIQILQSSGVDELDRETVDVIKRWKFKPATMNGQPVDSQVRLHFDFEVNG